MENQIPLCVDLDGTVVYGDMSWKSFVAYVRCNPFRIIQVLWWHRLGRAYTKYKLCKRYNFRCEQLKFIPQTLEFIKQEKEKGRFSPKYSVSDSTERVLLIEIAENI